MKINWRNAVWNAVGAIGGMAILPGLVSRIFTIPPTLSATFAGSVSIIGLAGATAGIMVVEAIRGGKN